jgi:hypothetical protein
MTYEIIKSKGWLQTDASLETMQYGRKISEYVWEYREVDKQYLTDEKALSDFDNWHEDEIDVLLYSMKDLRNIINSYGYTMDDYHILEQSGEIFTKEDSIQLIAECVFEYEHY